MLRIGSKNSRVSGNNNATPPWPQLVAVAVDGDKNSQHALKWAADHILSRGEIFVLIHVRRKITTIRTPAGQRLPISEVEREVASAFHEEMDRQTKELLLPFQCFCSRRGLTCKEVILDDTNISKAIVDFVMHHTVDKLVLGASSRNAFIRTCKQADVPTSVSKIAPEFCSIYVISKGKISSARPATRPKYHINTLVSKFETAGNQFQSIKSETVVDRHHIGAPRRFASMHSARTGYGSNSGSGWGCDPRINEKFGGVSHAGGHLDFSYQRTASCPSPSRTTSDQQSSYLPRVFLDGGRQPLRLSGSSNNEHTYLEEQRENFELMTSSDDLSSDSGSSGYEHSPPIAKKEVGPSWSDHSVAHYKKAVGKLAMEESWLDRKKTLELAEKAKQRFRIQDSQKKMEVEASKAYGPENIMFPEVAEKFSSDARYRRYTIEEIQKATDNFSDLLKIGEGGYGPVFKSTLDHTPVAIKIPRPGITEGMKQFQQEVEVLSCIRHPNMVLLMGACPEYGCLVYEFMANGSLEDRLFCRSGTPPLPWQLRFKIAAEIATGLLFLHHTKPEPIVHRDLKPANILLDDNFVSKIADVALARLLPSTVANSTRYLSTSAAGTFCYIDPEYQKTGMVGVKSDVYALGILLLQLITAQPPMGLMHNIERALEMDKLQEMLDANVPDWPMEDTKKLAKLALMCAELRHRDRPDLAYVVLPELNRLRALADSTCETPESHYRRSSKSFKQPIWSPLKEMS